MNQVATQDQQNNALAIQEREFELVQRKAKMLAASDFVPDKFKNQIANCSLIVEMAGRLQTDPFLIAREIYLVHNKPAFSTKFAIAMLNRSGVLIGRLKFRDLGEAGTDSHGMEAYGTESATGETITGPKITIDMAKKEGWYSKNGSKWPTLTSLMLQYRAATFFINTNCPEIMMGAVTIEEAQDTPTERDITPTPPASRTATGQRVSAYDEPEDGEVITDTTEAQPATAPAEDKPDLFEAVEVSPAFTAVKSKILNVYDANECANIQRHELIKKCSAPEKVKLQEMIEARCLALESGAADSVEYSANQ